MALGSQAKDDPRVLELLVHTLRGDHSGEVRVQAVEKLGDLGTPAVVPALREVAIGADPVLRRAIAFAVATIEARAERD